MTAVDRLLATARAEIGYTEKASNSQLDDKTANAGDKNYTKYARDLDKAGIYNGRKQGYAWCDMFVDWCFVTAFGLEDALKLTCQDKNGWGAGCTASANYYKRKGRFFKINPKPGDQIFFRNTGSQMTHTGIVERVSGGYVYTIEGNTSNGAGVVSNGGSVRDKKYSLSYTRIAGYGRPDYSIIQVEDEDDEMTQEQFDIMFNAALREYRQTLQDNDSGVWSAAGRKFVVNHGIMAGGDPGSDGQPNYMWQDFLTREQAATLLYRFAQVFGLE